MATTGQGDGEVQHLPLETVEGAQERFEHEFEQLQHEFEQLFASNDESGPDGDSDRDSSDSSMSSEFVHVADDPPINQESDVRMF